MNASNFPATILPSIAPDGVVGRAYVGVYMWRMLQELHLPLYQRAAMVSFWVKALASRYWVSTLTPDGHRIGGLQGFFMPGNQREVLKAYDRIRREPALRRPARRAMRDVAKNSHERLTPGITTGDVQAKTSQKLSECFMAGNKPKRVTGGAL